MLKVSTVGFQATTSCDPTVLRDTATAVLTDEGFTVSGEEWTADATKGSIPRYVALGWMAQRFHVSVRIMSRESSQILLRVDRESLGFLGGGMIGSRRCAAMLAW